jgi:hypothetical protein
MLNGVSAAPPESVICALEEQGVEPAHARTAAEGVGNARHRGQRTQRKFKGSGQVWLGSALFRFWEMREHLNEGRARLGHSLVVAGDQFPKERARILQSPHPWPEERRQPRATGESTKLVVDETCALT